MVNQSTLLLLTLQVFCPIDINSILMNLQHIRFINILQLFNTGPQLDKDLGNLPTRHRNLV